jgi:outer membrane murein-binding lipoprotein Lpp
MKRNSITKMSRAVIAAVMLATAALAGCASVGDESFIYAGNDAVPHDRMEGA